MMVKITEKANCDFLSQFYESQKLTRLPNYCLPSVAPSYAPGDINAICQLLTQPEEIFIVN
jgi:hypothetical protein